MPPLIVKKVVGLVSSASVLHHFISNFQSDWMVEIATQILCSRAYLVFACLYVNLLTFSPAHTHTHIHKFKNLHIHKSQMNTFCYGLLYYLFHYWYLLVNYAFLLVLTICGSQFLFVCHCENLTSH